MDSPSYHDLLWARERTRPTETRPHTVHAESPTCPPFGNSMENDASDSEPALRAPAAGPSVFKQRQEFISRRLSRDDTANDLHMWTSRGSASHGTSGLSSRRENIVPQANNASADNLRSWPSIQRGAPLPQSRSAVYANPVGSEPSESFARRISKRISAAKPLQKFAHVPSRHRRSSVPNRIELSDDTEPAEVPLPPPPTSPSKRSARQTNDRPRKHRNAGQGLLQQFGDRKDTPAPAAPMAAAGPAASSLAVRLAATKNNMFPRGGDGARKAAASYNSQPQFELGVLDPDFEAYHADLLARRARLGSLSSAADSGADLTQHSDSEGHPHDSDIDIDIDMSSDEDGPPVPRDFVQLMPDEIALAVFEYLDAQDLLRAELVSKKWRTMARDTSVWRHAFLRKYQREALSDPPPIQVGGAGCGLPNTPNQQWRKMYKARGELEKNWRRGADGAGKAIYLSGHTDSVYCLQFDEEKIITGSRDRTIRVWDINTFQCLRVIGAPQHKPTLGPKVLRTVDYPSFHMATASVNGTAYGESIYHVPREWHDASILCLQYDDEILVTGSSDADLLIWDIKTYEPIRRLRKHTGGVLDVALDAKHIVSCSKDSRIIVWDRETFEPKGDLTGHRGPVNAVQLRGNLLVSASGDGIARLWDLKKMILIKEFSAKERGLAAVEFSEDMKYVLAGGNDNITYKFEVETGCEVMQFTGHSQLVRSLWLDSANNRVVSGSYDLDLRVYDFVTGDELWRGEEWTTSWMLAAKSDYRRVVATSQDGRILIVDFGILKGKPTYQSRDGMVIEDIELLRGQCKDNSIKWTNPWNPAVSVYNH